MGLIYSLIVGAIVKNENPQKPVINEFIHTTLLNEEESLKSFILGLLK
jgi:hypothetical protein